jgi:hypothetical protein
VVSSARSFEEMEVSLQYNIVDAADPAGGLPPPLPLS